MTSRRPSNVKRTEWNKKCRERLSAHICRSCYNLKSIIADTNQDKRLGIVVKESQVRLKTNADDPYNQLIQLQWLGCENPDSSEWSRSIKMRLSHYLYPNLRPRLLPVKAAGLSVSGMEWHNWSYKVRSSITWRQAMEYHRLGIRIVKPLLFHPRQTVAVLDLWNNCGCHLDFFLFVFPGSWFHTFE